MEKVKKEVKNLTNKVIHIAEIGGNEVVLFIDRSMEEVGKASAAKQFILGISSGWIAGCLSVQVGKRIIFYVISCFKILDITINENGLQIEWLPSNQEFGEIPDGQQSHNWKSKVIAFAKANPSFTAGFVGGLLIAIPLLSYKTALV